MTEKTIKHLLQRYIAGEADPDETIKVEEWYAALNKDSEELSSAKKRAIGVKILFQLQQAMDNTPTVKKIKFPEMLTKIAAILLISVALGLGFWKFNQPAKDALSFASITTKAGERKRITLSDGSIVMLEPSGKLTYPVNFKPNSRSVELVRGEAFFTVTHDVKRPFTVHAASGLNIKVLGTSFNVKTSASSPEILVDVASGKVAVSSPKHFLGVLTKGRSLKYDKKTGMTSLHRTPHQKFINLAFEGATLKQVVQQLEYVYNIRILLGEGVTPELKCTAVFSSRQKPEEILDIICSLHHLKFDPSTNHKSFKIYR